MNDMLLHILPTGQESHHGPNYHHCIQTIADLITILAFRVSIYNIKLFLLHQQQCGAATVPSLTLDTNGHVAIIQCV